MKKRKFQSGGLTQADRDAGLTEADIALGLRAGKSSSITDDEREAAIARANRLDAESIVDKYRDFDKNPAAQAMPVDMGARRAPRAAPSPAPRARSSAMAEEGPSPVPGTQMAETEPGATRPSPPPRARRAFDDLMKFFRNKENYAPSPYPRGARTEAQDVPGAKRGGSVKKMVAKASSASKRADGIATKGKTKGRMV